MSAFSLRSVQWNSCGIACICKHSLCVTFSNLLQQDETRPEDEMAQRRAALLEKQQKRAEEIKRKRQEQEREREAR